MQGTRRDTQHDHDPIVLMGAGAQAFDYAVSLGVWTEGQVLVKQV